MVILVGFAALSMTVSPEQCKKVELQVTENYGEELDKQPQFVDGQEGLVAFISENMIYPQHAKDNNIEGTSYIEFIVKANGEITEVSVKASSHPILDEEALRVVHKMPNWEPGVMDGQAVSAQVTLPIKFKL